LELRDVKVRSSSSSSSSSTEGTKASMLDSAPQYVVYCKLQQPMLHAPC
jgi:hypothetical protein